MLFLSCFFFFLKVVSSMPHLSEYSQSAAFSFQKAFHKNFMERTVCLLSSSVYTISFNYIIVITSTSGINRLKNKHVISKTHSSTYKSRNVCRIRVALPPVSIQRFNMPVTAAFLQMERRGSEIVHLGTRSQKRAFTGMFWGFYSKLIDVYLIQLILLTTF